MSFNKVLHKCNNATLHILSEELLPPFKIMPAPLIIMCHNLLAESHSNFGNLQLKNWRDFSEDVAVKIFYI